MQRYCWLLALSLLLSGCESLHFYQQAIRGHLDVLARSQPIPELLADTETPAALKQRLNYILTLRTFAEEQLALPVGDHYLNYADIERPFVVWNVFAAPRLSFAAKHWCYPVAGCASYRGYYRPEHARALAQQLQQQGYDVHVGGVAAYSTLGWFDDPVLNTFIQRSDTRLADLLFHELAHQRLYLPGDTVFNESFATVVAREGVKRWLQQQDAAQQWQAYQRDQQVQTTFITLVLDYRQRLEQLYASDLSEEEKLQQKDQVIAQLEQAYQQQKAQWGEGYYDHWFAQPINNARLLTIATYHDQVPAFSQLLANHYYDFAAFYQACVELTQLSAEQRQQALAALAQQAQEAGYAPSP